MRDFVLELKEFCLQVKYSELQRVYLFIASEVLLTAGPVSLGTAGRSGLRAFKVEFFPSVASVRRSR